MRGAVLLSSETWALTAMTTIERIDSFLSLFAKKMFVQIYYYSEYASSCTHASHHCSSSEPTCASNNRQHGGCM